jgi:hypothetical protein
LLQDLPRLGVQDVLVSCIDNLHGFAPGVIGEAVVKSTLAQTSALLDTDNRQSGQNKCPAIKI